MHIWLHLLWNHHGLIRHKWLLWVLKTLIVHVWKLQLLLIYLLDTLVEGWKIWRLLLVLMLDYCPVLHLNQLSLQSWNLVLIILHYFLIYNFVTWHLISKLNNLMSCWPLNWTHCLLELWHRLIKLRHRFVNLLCPFLAQSGHTSQVAFSLVQRVPFVEHVLLYWELLLSPVFSLRRWPLYWTLIIWSTRAVFAFLLGVRVCL